MDSNLPLRESRCCDFLDAEDVARAHDGHGDFRLQRFWRLDWLKQHRGGMPVSMICPSVAAPDFSHLSGGIGSSAKRDGPASPKKRYCEIVPVNSWLSSFFAAILPL